MGEGEGYLIVPTPVEHTLSFRGQYSIKLHPYCSRGHSISAGRLRGQPVSMTLPHSFVQDSPIQVRPIILMWKDSVDLLKQPVCTLWGKVRTIRLSHLGEKGDVTPLRNVSTGTPMGTRILLTLTLFPPLSLCLLGLPVLFLLPYLSSLYLFSLRGQPLFLGLLSTPLLCLCPHPLFLYPLGTVV